jgi:hypothetical protein
VYPVSSRYLDAHRRPHVKTSRALHRNVITGVTTSLPIEDGSVSISSSARTRRTLSLTIPNTQALWDVLDTVGGEITVSKTMRFPDSSRETVPLGVFVVDQDQIGYGPGDTISITAPDRWIKVQRNNFAPTARGSIASNAAWQEIKRLVEGAWPGVTYPFPGWADGSPTHAATTKVGSVLWDDGDRDAAIGQLCTDNSLDVYFNELGEAVLRPMPTPNVTTTPVWTVDAGETGVLVAADRTRDRSTMHNAIIVTTSATDIVFNPVEVKLTTAGDPLNTTGPLGYVPLDYSSPTLRNSTQAQAAGLTMLTKNLGVAKQVHLSAVSNDALDAWDVVKVMLPRTDLSLPRPIEIHVLDTITIPLTPSGAQDLQTRSTRPDTDGS